MFVNIVLIFLSATTVNIKEARVRHLLVLTILFAAKFFEL